MWDLCKGNVVEELDKGLAGNVLLVTGESFDCDEDEGGGNGKNIQ